MVGILISGILLENFWWGSIHQPIVASESFARAGGSCRSTVEAEPIGSGAGLPSDSREFLAWRGNPRARGNPGALLAVAATRSPT